MCTTLDGWLAVADVAMSALVNGWWKEYKTAIKCQRLMGMSGLRLHMCLKVPIYGICMYICVKIYECCCTGRHKCKETSSAGFTATTNEPLHHI